MRIAKDLVGFYVDIDDAAKDGVYVCPDCGETLLQRRGSVRIHHFSHKARSDCVGRWEPMTEWHLGWQQKFPIECREVAFESDGRKHRADVCVGDIVLEFQHSPISESKWQERTDFYKNVVGKSVFWVYDYTDRDSSPLHNRWPCHPEYKSMTRPWEGWVPYSTLVGDKAVVNREFRRSCELYGSNHPVFLHFPFGIIGAFWDFRYVSGYAGCYSRSCVYFDETEFVSIVTDMADSGCMDFNAYVMENEQVFVRRLFDLAKRIDSWEHPHYCSNYKTLSSLYGHDIIVERCSYEPRHQFYAGIDYNDEWHIWPELKKATAVPCGTSVSFTKEAGLIYEYARLQLLDVTPIFEVLT